MYHRVIPKKFVPWVEPGMFVEPATFENHVKILNEFFRLITIEDLGKELLFESGQISERPACLLTFDDGWFDFFEYAYPVLNKYRFPALVFLPTDYIGSNDWFWTDRMCFLIYHQLSTSNVHGRAFKCTALGNNTEIGFNESSISELIDRLKKLSDESIENIIDELSDEWGMQSRPPGRSFLSWEEVIEMKQSGIISFGSHTARHRILDKTLNEDVRKELLRSKDALLSRGLADIHSLSFCYPNGNFNERVVDMVKESSYRYAFTTKQGCNKKGANQHALLRIGMHQDITSNKVLMLYRILDSCRLL